MNIYDLLGKEDGIFKLVDRFYELMDTLPEAKAIRAMHPKNLSESKKKLAWFLCGRFGGPNLYVETFGHPRLRMRHMPFAIDSVAANAWMACMDQALDERVSDTALKNEIKGFFAHVADFMRNRPDST